MKPRQSFLAAFRSVLVRASLKFANYLEAGRRWNPSRSFLPGEIRDARFDVSSVERLEVVRKSRYFQYNNALANRLCDLFEQYTVGAQGLQLTPASVDDVWNEKAAIAWRGWGKFADLTSRQSFGVLQGLMARLWFFDGEVFIIKTKGTEKITPTPGEKPVVRPRIQLVETHRVATPSSMTGEEGRRIIDGIEVDDKGRPIAYWIRDAQVSSFEASSYKRYPADEIIHLFEPYRAGQYRGLPLLYPVINDLHDLDDLQIFEMQAAKQNSQVTRTVMNASGEAEDETESVPFTIKQKSTDTQTVTREQFYKTTFGAGVHYLKPGDEYKEYVSNRPSVAVQEYWDYLITKCCMGVGISKTLAYPPARGQGTIIRGDYDSTNAYFQARSAVISDAVQEVYRYVMNWEVNYNPVLLGDKPSGWDTATTCAPRAVNADVGHNSSAMLAELAAGATTYEAIYAPQGKNWKRELAQAAREVAFIKYQAELASKIYPGIEVKPGEIAEKLIVEVAPVQTQEVMQ